ncbi:hypothetical protein CONLIGDRAFT_634907 [Coniochaeta ligniaria NRRL 30616]|uniref:Uncharacterized protein n=1 Tax=Coniochaeta ligniaria NRRL 30616 TaxID=1408157 RepID=A0A1J7JBQ7_9PEZI|nr:hypothetical protein CONLIGDRAFT_634907 [Coniochaeta ligniaria NRRL 30616]
MICVFLRCLENPWIPYLPGTLGGDVTAPPLPSIGSKPGMPEVQDSFELMNRA